MVDIETIEEMAHHIFDNIIYNFYQCEKYSVQSLLDCDHYIKELRTREESDDFKERLVLSVCCYFGQVVVHNLGWEWEIDDTQPKIVNGIKVVKGADTFFPFNTPIALYKGAEDKSIAGTYAYLTMKNEKLNN